MTLFVAYSHSNGAGVYGFGNAIFSNWSAPKTALEITAIQDRIAKDNPGIGQVVVMSWQVME